MGIINWLQLTNCGQQRGRVERGKGGETSGDVTRNYAHGCTLGAFVARGLTTVVVRAVEEEGGEGGGGGQTWGGECVGWGVASVGNASCCCCCCCCLRPAFNTQFNTKFMGSVSDDMRRTRNRNWNCSWNSEIPEFGMCNRLSKWVLKASSPLSRLGDSHTSLHPLQGAGRRAGRDTQNNSNKLKTLEFI